MVHSNNQSTFVQLTLPEEYLLTYLVAASGPPHIVPASTRVCLLPPSDTVTETYTYFEHESREIITVSFLLWSNLIK